MTRVEESLRQRWIEAVVEEGERVGVLAQELGDAGRLDVRLPWVPAWSARDLVAHLGVVHRWATAIVTAGHDRTAPDEELPPSDGLLDWYGAGLTGLVRALRETPPDAPAWHMSPAAERVAASWARRQAHELAVHRHDLEAAAGRPHEPLDDDLAEDGVDELLSIVVPRWAHTEPVRSAVATVAVTSSTGRGWTVAVERGAVTVVPTSDPSSDAVLAGDPVALLLHLWGRPADVVITGDPAAEALLRGR
jgi:uncharacterized protein (TIGR03083 family)